MLASKPRPTAQASIEIEAPIELVWDIMLDHRRYPEWNPFIFRVDCAAERFAPGVDFRLHVRWANGKSTLSRERVAAFEPPAARDDRPREALLAYEFRGLLHTSGLVRGTRLQRLRQAPGGATTYLTEETFRGVLASQVPLRDVQDGFERHARALAARAGSLARPS